MTRHQRVDLGWLDRLRLGWRLLRDPRVSGWKWVVPAAATIIICSPQSLLPVIGELDDVGLLTLALAAVALLVRFAPAAVMREHAAALGLAAAGDRARDEAPDAEEPGVPEYWVDDWR